MPYVYCYVLLTWGARHGYKIQDHPAAHSQLRNIRARLREERPDLRIAIKAYDYARKVDGPEDLPGLFDYFSKARRAEMDSTLVLEDFNRIFRACTPDGKLLVQKALMDYGDLMLDARTSKRLEQLGRSEISRLVRDNMKPLNLAQRPRRGCPEGRREQTEQARKQSQLARKAISDRLTRDLLALRERIEQDEGKITVGDLVDHANRAGMRNTRGRPLTYQTVARMLQRAKNETKAR